jgi:hypothetical protein
MRSASIARPTLLGALVALTLLASVLLVAAPKASASKGECPSNSVCVWSAVNFNGTISHWSEFSLGCHSHASNPEIRSGWNNSNFFVRFGGRFTKGPHTFFENVGGEGPITGEICWE